MAEPSTSNDLLAAAAHALRGDRTRVRDLLAGVKERAEDRARDAIAHQRESLETLQQAHDELSKKVEALQEQADQALVRLFEGVRGFDQQFQSISAQNQQTLTTARLTRAAAVRQGQELRSLAATARVQQITSVITSTQSAAYGTQGSVLATNNLLLAGNQLFWMFLDPILRGLGIVKSTAPGLAVWLAPLGSLVTGQLVLANRQHVRFVSGIATFDRETTIIVHSLRNDIASSLWPKFQQRTDIPVSVVALDGAVSSSIVASIRNGVLIIAPAADEGVIPGRVAWMIDTGVAGG